MKIIDTTTYFEEKLMMDLRFKILNPYVDQFIVCEARFTHSGKEKEINFKKENYAEFEHKIVHQIIDKEPLLREGSIIFGSLAIIKTLGKKSFFTNSRDKVMCGKVDRITSGFTNFIFLMISIKDSLNLSFCKLIILFLFIFIFNGP